MFYLKQTLLHLLLLLLLAWLGSSLAWWLCWSGCLTMGVCEHCLSPYRLPKTSFACERIWGQRMSFLYAFPQLPLPRLSTFRAPDLAPLDSDITLPGTGSILTLGESAPYDDIPDVDALLILGAKALFNSRALDFGEGQKARRQVLLWLPWSTRLLSCMNESSPYWVSSSNLPSHKLHCGQPPLWPRLGSLPIIQGDRLLITKWLSIAPNLYPLRSSCWRPSYPNYPLVFLVGHPWSVMSRSTGATPPATQVLSLRTITSPSYSCYVITHLSPLLWCMWAQTIDLNIQSQTIRESLRGFCLPHG